MMSFDLIKAFVLGYNSASASKHSQPPSQTDVLISLSGRISDLRAIIFLASRSKILRILGCLRISFTQAFWKALIKWGCTMAPASTMLFLKASRSRDLAVAHFVREKRSALVLIERRKFRTKVARLSFQWRQTLSG